MRVVDRVDTGLSMTTSFNGTAIGVDHLEGLSVCIAVTETSASLAGTLKLQASNNAFLDTNSNNTVDPNAVWVDISGSSVALTAGSGNYMFNVSEIYYRAVRIVWTSTSGEGTAIAYWHGKGPQS